MSDLPTHLKSTVKLLRAAFPEGVSQSDLPFLLKVLYEHFSDENLATVVAYWLNLDNGLVLNEVYRSFSLSEDQREVKVFEKKLYEHGIDKWLEENC